MRVEVQDIGKYYKVTDVYLGIHEKIKSRGLSFMFKDLALYRYLKKKLDNNISIFMLKAINNISIDDFIFGIDGTDSFKKISIKRVNKELSRRERLLIFYYNYVFENLNNILKSNGFDINSTDKEDMYLEILSAGDDNMIDILQQYLEIQSLIEEFLSIYNMCVSTHKEINTLSTSLEISNINLF